MISLNQLMASLVGGSTPGPSVDSVFGISTYYGAGATQTSVVNNIDLAGKGGLVWAKSRSTAGAHTLIDTATPTKAMDTSSTAAQITMTSTFSANSTGFAVSGTALPSTSGSSFVAWTFAKSKRFFDSIRYTGTGTDDLSLPHNLGVAPGMVVVKNISTGDWVVGHRSFTGPGHMLLNSTAAFVSTASPSRVQWDANNVYVHGGTLLENTAGSQYVAYVFAHDDATDGIIQCGNYTGNGAAAGPSINLGWEPQFVMIKNSTSAFGWAVFDTSRGMGVSLADDSLMYLGATSAEVADSAYITPTATGFTLNSPTGALNASGSTYIYMAIRKASAVQPTSGTQVFAAVISAGNGTARDLRGVNFAPDMVLSRLSTATPTYLFDRVKSTHRYSTPTSTAAEATDTLAINSYSTDGIQLNSSIPNTTGTWTHFLFKRAQGVFDIVTWTGNGSAGLMNHNLGVPPELIIAKNRGAATDWQVMNVYGKSAIWNTTAAGIDQGNSAGYVTNTTFSLLGAAVNSPIYTAGINYIAYLFATKAGISKVGQYTGDGNTSVAKSVACGFSGPARFVMIKNMDAVGDWMVWDYAHGISATSSESRVSITNAANAIITDAVLTAVPGGFTVLQTALSNANVAGNNYLFLAFA